MKLSDYAKKLGVTYRTAWNHWKSGKITGTQLETGTIIVTSSKSEEEFNNRVIIYARVSSSENKSNLDSQAERLKQFAILNGYIVDKIVKEIGSGVNDSRKQLIKILQLDSYNKIIVEHKDRLTRFGFNYIETLLNKLGKEIIVVNKASDDKEDLIQDFISIITSFCSRIYGQRRTKRNTEKLLERLKND